MVSVYQASDGKTADKHSRRTSETQRRSRRSLVILSAGCEAAGVEGSHWSRATAAAKALPGREAFVTRPGVLSS